MPIWLEANNYNQLGAVAGVATAIRNNIILRIHRISCLACGKIVIHSKFHSPYKYYGKFKQQTWKMYSWISFGRFIVHENLVTSSSAASVEPLLYHSILPYIEYIWYNMHEQQLRVWKHIIWWLRVMILRRKWYRMIHHHRQSETWYAKRTMDMNPIHIRTYHSELLLLQQNLGQRWRMTCSMAKIRKISNGGRKTTMTPSDSIHE